MIQFSSLSFRRMSVQVNAIWRMKYGHVLLAILIPLSANASAEPVLDLNGVRISEDDVVHYVEQRFKNTDVEKGLNKPGAFARIIEDLYVVARVADEGRSVGSVDDATLEWIARDSVNRVLLNAVLESRVEEVLGGVDWNSIAEEYYRANIDDFLVSEERSVDHILVSSEDRSWEEFLAKVRQVQSRLDAGEDFNQIAEEMSDDPSVTNNRGSLGLVSRGQTAPQFETATWTLEKPGQIAGPVLTAFGAHFIKLREIRENGAQPFAQVRPGLVAKLRRQRGAAVRQQIIDRTRAELSGVELDIDKDVVAQRLGVHLSSPSES